MATKQCEEMEWPDEPDGRCGEPAIPDAEGGRCCNCGKRLCRHHIYIDWHECKKAKP